MLKENILGHIQQSEIKKKWRGILDQAEQVMNKHVIRKTLFLSPGEWNYAESILCHYSNVQWLADGGYENAERKRLVIFPDYKHYDSIEDFIALLKIKHNAKTGDLTHRDYLGALLSLGIEREIIGDIIVGEDWAYLFTTSEMKDFIKFNLNTVGSSKVMIEDADSLPDDVESDQMIIIAGTVASLRIDSVISMVLRLSRQKSQSLVTSHKVKINWVPVQKNMLLLKERDMISVSGFGRFKLLSIGNLTRSQRWRIEVGKMK